MKNITPIAVALLIVAVFSITIFASGNALSFSLPTSNEGATVAQQQNIPPQPNEYVDQAKHHFGPDFMCLIYADTNTIECFGSDAHGIVSNSPTKSGFTAIDGGETYACSYHRIDAFTHCWGSITRSPSTVLPTATTIPTATAEPTATTVPGGTPPPTPTITPTPQPTSTSVPITRTACHIPRTGSATYPLTLTGTWKSSCVFEDGNPFIIDEWRQKGTGAVTITAMSDGDPNLLLAEVDDSKSPGDDGWLTALAYNDDIDEDGGNYDAQVVHTLENGKRYLVSVSPYRDNSRDSFTLTYTSTVPDLGWAASHDPIGLTPLDQAKIQSIMQSAATK